MASITRQHQGKYTYLYESHSYRDEQGRPRNHKKKIGTVNPQTGKPRYTAEYLERMRQAGTPLSVSVFDSIDGFEQRMQEALDSVRDYGLFYFLKQLAEKMGILAILQETLPTYWRELCTLSFYMLAGDKPLMYLDMWLAENEHFSVGNMDSRRISELLLAFGQKERNAFYAAWLRKKASGEYLALDITSLSSYSNLIPDCEWGYNRDGEELAQINMCLLCGEKSYLPVYQTLYSGSLTDSSTFRTTIEELRGISGGKRLVLVMDKGFYSEKNLKMLIQEGHRFLIALPFTLSAAKRLVEAERRSIDQAVNIIKTSSRPIRGVSRKLELNGTVLTAHILYNPERELTERNKLYAHAAWLQEQVLAGKRPAGFDQDIEKYLTVYHDSTGIEVKIRQEAIDQELASSGWVVIVGNENIATQEAHDIYRRKDVVEKAFMSYKNKLGMSRLRIHDGERMRNKALISFISLTLVSEIHRVMKEQDLYKKMTVDKLLLTLAKLKLLVIDSHHILRPLTKEQRELFSAFSLPPPVVG
jgi:transposase